MRREEKDLLSSFNITSLHRRKKVVTKCIFVGKCTLIAIGKAIEFHCHFIHFSFLFYLVCVTEIDGIDPDEKVFLERLNNTSRFYETIPRAVRTAATPRPDPNSSSELVNNVKNRTPRPVSICNTCNTYFLYILFFSGKAI